MPVDPKRQWLVRATDRTEQTLEAQQHPLNPLSEVRGWSLSDLTGLQRAGVYLLKLAPGKESFVYHSHQLQEEWMSVLSGRGLAEVDGEELELGPGDFLGFPTPSVAHHLRNKLPKSWSISPAASAARSRWPTFRGYGSASCAPRRESRSSRWRPAQASTASQSRSNHAFLN